MGHRVRYERLVARGATVLALVLSVSGVALVGYAGAAKPDGATTPSEVPEPGEEFFVVEARRGSLVDQDDGTFELTLRGVDPDALVYTDRTDRFAGTITARQIVERWDETGMEEEPPSAALAVVDGKGSGSAVAYELSDPARDKRTLTFTATPSESFESDPDVAASIREHVADANDDLPSQFGSSALFIDPVNDAVQYCFARIENNSGTTVAGVGALLLAPRSFPIGTIPKGGITEAASLGLGFCSIAYTYTTGARSWALYMDATTGKDNSSSCSGNCKRTVTHDTSTYRVTFEFVGS